jgi:6-pyruvoyltetrahydropterin/6-carboxytetrahydropterin synthase
MMLLTRRYPFSAAHKLWNPDFTEAENAQHFGPCARLHGHNYMLEVTIAGVPAEKTGMIMDIVALDALVHESLISIIDHRYLDEDVPFLNGVLSTCENVVQVFYDRLASEIPKPATLYRIRLYESEMNWAEVAAEGAKAL